MSSAAAGSPRHILVFPFSSPGHIIPLLDLTRLFITRGLTVTVLVPPSHVHLLQPMLSSSSSIEPLVLDCSESFQSASGLPAKIRATATLYDPILQWFRSHPSPPVAILSDMFLGWTQQLASELGVPRLVFWPSGALTASVSYSQWRNLPKNDDPGNENSLISFPEIPKTPTYRWSEIVPCCRDFKEGDADHEFLRRGMLANTESWGVVFNSFRELESVYFDHIKKIVGHNRVWAVGPLLPPEERVGPTNRGGSSSIPAHRIVAWLDEKADDSVVYVCFGSRVTLPRKQTEVLAAALECSGVHFIWCVKSADGGRVAGEDGGIPDGFEDRVGERGFIIRGWAAQVEILNHRAVGAFVTHCGWNSLLEGLTAGVLMLTWPMGADQFTDSKLLVDQLGVAIRACEGGPQRAPDLAELTRLLAEAVSGSRPERSRVEAFRQAARKAVSANGGSSTKDLEELVKQLGGLVKDGRTMNETNY